MLRIAGLIVLGVGAGYFSGLVGLGGGVIVLPVLVYLFGFSQHIAQGTTLAMLLPPIGLFAVMKYHQSGFVDWKVAALLCLGFLLGGWLGAKLAVGLPAGVLKKIFAVTLIAVGVKALIGK